MGFRWAYDASTPPSDPPKWYIVAGYIGGDTPHVWTKEEWDSQPAPKRLPIFTASNRADTAAAAGTDAYDIIRSLADLGVPDAVTVALDIETSVYSEYLLALNDFIAPHRLMPYGSLSTLVKNPRTSGGRWAADWTDSITTDDLIGTDDINMIQIASSEQTGHPWDWSLAIDNLLLWNR